ncbi:MAG: fibronectin type III domain-containing protein [Nitrospira sp.]|nr:fibronectin type III domain-containing protein [Nitrospira sp.]
MAWRPRCSWSGMEVVLLVALVIGLWTVTEASALTVSPTAVTFQVVQGATTPPSQTVSVSKPSLRQAKWTVTDNASWLTVSPRVGTITRTAQVAVAVKASGLAAGTYSGMVTVRVERGGRVSFPVLLKVAPAVPSNPVIPTSWPDTSATPSSTRNPHSAATLVGDGMRAVPGALPPTPMLSPMIGAGAMMSRTWNPYSNPNLEGGLPTTAVGPSPPVSAPQSMSTSVPHADTTATLTWNPVTGASLSGYKIYMGTASGQYGTPLDVGNVTSYAVNNLAMGNTYYFVVTSYSTSGTESLPSAEVSKSIY